MEYSNCTVKSFDPKTVKVEIGDVYLIRGLDWQESIDATKVVSVGDLGFEYNVSYGVGGFSASGQRGFQRLEDPLIGILVKQKNGTLEMYIDPILLEDIEKLKTTDQLS